MICRYCKKKAKIRVDYARIALCKNCFIKFFEDKVKRTVLKYKMIMGGDKVLVAVSGGKDSNSLAVVLKKLLAKGELPEFELMALHINLGIGTYSKECVKIVRKLCKQFEINLKIFDLKRKYNFTIDDVKKVRFRRNVCASCGIVKRYIFNKIANELKADKVATGHNMDDALAIIWDAYITGDFTTISKTHPHLPSQFELVARIKPLIELCEYETKAYAEFTNLPIVKKACIYGVGTRLKKRKKIINYIEKAQPSFKHTFWKTHLNKFLPQISKVVEFPEIKKCKKCNMPTSLQICSFCKLRDLIGKGRK
jgi:uncharacterized protein (TIGR00269 family)